MTFYYLWPFIPLRLCKAPELKVWNQETIVHSCKLWKTFWHTSHICKVFRNRNMANGMRSLYDFHATWRLSIFRLEQEYVMVVNKGNKQRFLQQLEEGGACVCTDRGKITKSLPRYQRANICCGNMKGVNLIGIIWLQQLHRRTHYADSRAILPGPRMQHVVDRTQKRSGPSVL